MNFQVREQIHRLIILDLTIRTLQRDLQHLNSLKLNRVFKIWMEKQVAELTAEKLQLKKDLYKQGIKIQNEIRGDDGFTEYEILDKGKLSNLRYSNIALRNWVDEEVKRLLQLDYRTLESGVREV